MNNIDKSTKFLLLVIGVALWIIALNPWLRPVAVAAAQGHIEYYLSSIEEDLSSIESEVGKMPRGLCLNLKIC